MEKWESEAAALMEKLVPGGCMPGCAESSFQRLWSAILLVRVESSESRGASVGLPS